MAGDMYRCFAGTSVMPGRTGSVSHSQLDKAYFQIPPCSFASISQVSQAPSNQLSCMPGTGTASMASGRVQLCTLLDIAQTATQNSVL